jgi:hypothetical protein
MWKVLVAATWLALFWSPGRAAACMAPPVPIFPGARQIAGVVSTLPGGSTGEGHTVWTTTASALDVQMFYYLNLPGDGWTAVAQMAGQYAEQFTGSENSSTTAALGALEFTRRRDAERVRIVTEPIGYSVWLVCRE